MKMTSGYFVVLCVCVCAVVNVHSKGIEAIEVYEKITQKEADEEERFHVNYKLSKYFARPSTCRRLNGCQLHDEDTNEIN